MYGSSFCIVTERPRHLSSRPRDEAVRPFPRLDATPPVTKMCLAKALPPDSPGFRPCPRCQRDRPIPRLPGGARVTQTNLARPSDSFGGWRSGRLDRQTRPHPAVEAAFEVLHLGVAHLGQAPAGQGGAGPGAAVEHDRRLPGQPAVDLHLQHPPGDRVGTRYLALAELVGFADVDDDDLLPALEARPEGGRPHLGDVPERLDHDLLKGLGGRHAQAGYWLRLPSPPCEPPARPPPRSPSRPWRWPFGFPPTWPSATSASTTGPTARRPWPCGRAGCRSGRCSPARGRCSCRWSGSSTSSGCARSTPPGCWRWPRAWRWCWRPGPPPGPCGSRRSPPGWRRGSWPPVGASCG